MSNANLPGDLKRLPDALRALPQRGPDRSVWPELAAQLAAARPRTVEAQRTAGGRARAPALARRRYLIPAALAAAVLLAVATGERLRRPAAPAAATIAPGAASITANAANSTNATSTQVPAAGAQIASLQQRSQALERWLHETARAAAPLSGQDLAAATEIEDMIGLVDGQLNAAPSTGELPLWRRRVALLEDLTALRYSNYRLAEAGVAASTPANWTN